MNAPTMSPGRPLPLTTSGGWPCAAALGAEMLLVALVWFGMHELAHLRLGVIGFSATWAVWSVVLAVRHARQDSGARAAWFWNVLELLGLGAGLGALNLGFAHPLPIGQMLYAVLLVGVTVHGWRGWMSRRSRGETGAVAEAARVLLLVAAGVAVMLPFLTDRFVGAIDARWYAYMLADFLEQLRAGQFPVFVGQGEFAWNGAVNPFRSAPAYLYVAGLEDLLTWRSLAVPALQHLAIITSALIGTVGFYAAGVTLAPRRRSEMALLALLFLAVPAWLRVLYHDDAYLTFLAFSAMPLVIYGNARALLTPHQGGHALLAVGLAWLWLCHPPIALLSVLATILLQGGMILFGGMPADFWGRALRALLLFASLSAGYFVAMSELPSFTDLSPVPDLLQLGGLALVLTGVVNAVLMRRGWIWLGLAVPGCWLLWLSRIEWMWWSLATAALAAAVAALGRWRPWFPPPRCALKIVVPCLLVAAALVQTRVGGAPPGRHFDSPAILRDNTAHWLASFLPVLASLTDGSRALSRLGPWLLVAVPAVIFGCSKRLALQMVSFVGLLLVLMFVRVPGISDFLLAYAPGYIADVVNLPLAQRLAPMLSVLVALGAVVWLAGAPADLRPRRRMLMLAALAAAGGWSGVEASALIRYGWGITDPRAVTQKLFRPENAMLDRYTYGLLPIPDYYSNGTMDVRLESRILSSAQRLLVGPDDTARRMEVAEGREVVLTSTAEPTAPAWLNLAPVVTLAPGERLLLRFEFLAKDYRGWLILRSDHVYREYLLPASGQAQAFGVGPGHSKVISLWNSGEATEDVRLFFQRSDPAAAGRDFGDFARLFVSRYRPAWAAVRTQSLIPYRVEVDMPVAGWLETPRVYVRGYTASVDDRSTPVSVSAQSLAMVPLTAGRHVVVMCFTGSARLWAAWWMSAAAWLGLIGYGWKHRGRPPPPQSGAHD